MNPSPFDILKAGRWEQAFFTTYALSLSFFEGVILDALVRGGNREALILADVAGVHSALGERGARRAGRDYEVEPVHVSGGCFHPKVSILGNADDVHVLVGSGNLTFGGWGNNLEVFEHLHPSFAPEAIADAADFLEQIATAPRLHHATGERCGILADDLRRRVRNVAGDGTIRIVHSLETSIVDRIDDLLSDMGQVRRMVVASPFWDLAGAGVDELCRRFGLDTVHVHAHPASAVRSAHGIDWPWNARTRVEPVSIQHFANDGANRSLHAKVFEFHCDGGRLVVSGSANATSAALGPGRNAEACVVRIQRNRRVFWLHDPASAPERVVDTMDDREGDDDIGVLRATLEGDILRGMVLAGLRPGRAAALLVTSDGIRRIGDLDVSRDGTFVIRSKGLEIDAWQAGRAIVRLEGWDGRRAEGFVSLAAVSGMIRRIGSIGRSLMSIISMNGTPDDIAAMMEWLHDNPDRYPREVTGGGNAERGSAQVETRTLVLSHVLKDIDVGHQETSSSGSRDTQEAIRFVRMLLSSIRTPTRQSVSAPATADDFVADDQETESEVDEQPAADSKIVERAFVYFERVFDAMLAREDEGFLHSALELMLFVCDRLEPHLDRIRIWMARIERSAPSGFPSTGMVSLRAGVVALAAATGADPVTTRGRLLRVGADLDDAMLDFEAIPGIAYIGRGIDLKGFWMRIRACRSLPEQNKSYLDQLRGRAAIGEYPDLMADPDLWQILGRGLVAPPGWNLALEARPGYDACPRCNIGLPIAEVRRLHGRYVATARNCCNRIVLGTQA